MVWVSEASAFDGSKLEVVWVSEASAFEGSKLKVVVEGGGGQVGVYILNKIKLHHPCERKNIAASRLV